MSTDTQDPWLYDTKEEDTYWKVDSEGFMHYYEDGKEVDLQFPMFPLED